MPEMDAFKKLNERLDAALKRSRSEQKKLLKDMQSLSPEELKKGLAEMKKVDKEIARLLRKLEAAKWEMVFSSLAKEMAKRRR